MELPLMYENSIAGTRAMMAMYKEGLISEDYSTVKVLALYVLPPYGIFTTGKKMAELKDLRGLRLRTPSATVGLALARLGTIPVGVPSNMMGEALDHNIIDGATYGWGLRAEGRGAG